ncbi:MAG: Flp pilus assembly complex ATPase component TadA [Elusimicrobia bacterium]|nr:Flp pilus assembly complex ATPase component TadA [Elusimicrobiota bacterium]
MVQAAGRKKSCKEILIDKQVLTEEQLKEVDSEIKKNGGLIQQVVIDMKLVEKGKILKLLSNEWGVKAIDLSVMDIDPDIAKIMPKQTTKRYNAVPFAKEENVLFVAMADPRDLFAIEDINLRTGFQVQPYLTLPEDIKNAISKIYAEEQQVQEEEEEAPEQTGSVDADDAKEMTEELIAGLDDGGDIQVDKDAAAEPESDIMQVDTAAPEVEKLINAIILEAVRVKASDIHIEPFEKKLAVRYRVDGNLRRATFKIPMSYKQALIAKIKIMTGSMNLTERRIPQDGRIMVKAKGRPIEFRVNIVPTINGESAVMRILDRSGGSAKLEQLGFLPDTVEKLLASLDKPYGLILVCGPTGSGKSYTLSAALAAVKDPEEKILTAENPVEYNLDGVVQVQVNPDLKMGDKCFDFSMALRSFLRQDPDTIMVGEIRDAETGQIAMEAAMTGHLVLSTLHTNDAPSAISRLSEMGIHTFLVANTTECILAQRLVGTLCKNCKEPDPSPNESYLKILDEHKIDYSKATFMRPKKGGCPKCGGRGMKGRTGIHELLVMDPELRKFCIKEVAVGPIRDMAIKHGMRQMIDDGLMKVTMGVTTFEEIFVAAG